MTTEIIARAREHPTGELGGSLGRPRGAQAQKQSEMSKNHSFWSFLVPPMCRGGFGWHKFSIKWHDKVLCPLG